MINDALSLVDFRGLRQSDQDAFGAGTVRIETLPAGFQLFKLTAGTAAAGKYGITPWWNPVKPFKEDYEGALGRYEQAKLNKIDMSAMVRFMSAVCIDWNDLDNYVQVKLNNSCKAFWGTFAPQKKFSKPAGSLDETIERNIKDFTVNKGAELPPDLGSLEAWQFYIPESEGSGHHA